MDDTTGQPCCSSSPGLRLDASQCRPGRFAAEQPELAGSAGPAAAGHGVPRRPWQIGGALKKAGNPTQDDSAVDR
eukprot:366145-Chlamydomonas_euryale.AAC.11